MEVIAEHGGPCPRLKTDEGCYRCCQDCNYDTHRCHFCGDPLTHIGHVYASQQRVVLPQPHLPEGFRLNRCYVPTVYTDGSSTGGVGDGGWAWVAYEGHDADEEISHGFDWDTETTNQQMELMAALKAIEAFPTTGIHIVSDSAYLVNCFVQQWYIRWGAKDWRKVKNRDIWEPLITAVLEREPGCEVQFEHIRGHQGVVGNERADELCGLARRAHLSSEVSVDEETIDMGVGAFIDSASSTEREQ